MANLYQLTNDMLALQHSLEDGELTPDTEAALDRISGELTTKAAGYCHVLRQLQADAEMFKAEEQRLRELRQQRENAVDRLKQRLHDAMLLLGMDRIDAGLFRLTICKNSRPSIKWVGSMDELPFEYQKITITEDKDKALADLKAGKDLPSQFEVTHSTHLRVR